MPKKSKTQRAAGILMPVSSLPSGHGIGALGKAAYRWVDFLCNAKQSYWQVLPLNPTSFGDSPYQSVSAFAGNPYFIDLDMLCENGLLTKKECAGTKWGGDSTKIDYEAIFKRRERLLRKAFGRFKDFDGLVCFCEKNASWLDDYALYMAVKAKMKLTAWNEWDEDIRLRKPAALNSYKKALEADIRYHSFAQYLFYGQWNALKAYANGKGVRIIGDIPIYVSMDSADTWARSELFMLDKNKLPVEVAGVPPDAFSADGQLWGNPLYRWDKMAEDGYAWWLARLNACLGMYDVLRIDHFRGLESYYAIPYGNKTAVDGVWRKGPGMDFIRAVNAEFKGAGIIAEDLGFLTPAVRRLLRESGYPGMKVLQFAFDSREESDYMPHNYTPHCVVYTGTHDNDTTRGWFDNTPRKDVSVAKRYLGIKSKRGGANAFIRAALASVAYLAIVPIQDYLDLDSGARVNTPSTIGGNNWRWRLSGDMLTPGLEREIAAMTKLYGRCPREQKR